MGKPSQFPPGPISTQVEEGREQFRKLTKPFMRQWSQPQLLKLMEACLKDKVFHSTHITGFSKGLLRDPGPKGFLALGLFNQALAEGKLPDTLRGLWEGKKAMVSTTNQPLGPMELFGVFTGLVDLGLEDVREIPSEKEEKVIEDLANWFRKQLAMNDVNWVTKEARRIKELSPTIEHLLWGRALHGEDVVAVIPLIAREARVTEAEVWDVIEASINDTPEG